MTKVILPFAVAIENIVLWRYAFKLGIKKEQQARLRRINALRRLIGVK